MDISTVLNVKNIKLNMTAKTKEEAVEELTDLLVQDAALLIKMIFFATSGFVRHRAPLALKTILRSHTASLRA